VSSSKSLSLTSKSTPSVFKLLLLLIFLVMFILFKILVQIYKIISHVSTLFNYKTYYKKYIIGFSFLITQVVNKFKTSGISSKD
jgi:hypothetical protein